MSSDRIELPDRIRVVNLLEEREPRPLELLGPVLAERILRHGQADATPNVDASRGWRRDGSRPRADRRGLSADWTGAVINPGYVRRIGLTAEIAGREPCDVHIS